MAQWSRKAEKVVVIDGCFMHCHGRMMKNLVGHENMIQFDALPMYNKNSMYSNTMLIDEVPRAQRQALARRVAAGVLAAMKQAGFGDRQSQPASGCASPK